MKRLRYLPLAALAALTITSCSNNNGGDVKPLPSAVIDFEAAQLGTVTIGANSYSNVLTGKGQATLQPDGNTLFNDILFTEDNAGFGSYFNDNATEIWGPLETWAGFAISSNRDLEGGDLTKQFSVYAQSASKFAVGYDMRWNDLCNYDRPTIVFDTPQEVISAKIANSNYSYHHCKSTPKVVVNEVEEAILFELVIKGYKDNTDKGEIRVTLASGADVLANWKTVSFASLGEVDKIEFSFNSNDYMTPLYFCVDDMEIK